jgi:hypothetical protein
MLKIDKAQLDVIINGDPARLKLSELSKEASTLKKEINSAKDEMERSVKLDKLKAVETEMESLRHEIGLAGMSMKELGQRSTQLKTILANLKPGTTDFKNYKKELQDVKARQDELRGSSSKLQGAFSGLKDLLPTLGIGALVAGIVSLGKAIFNTRAEFQKYEAILKNTLGSEDAGRQALSMLTDAASELPISLKDATEGFIKLANRGIIPTKGELVKLTDIAMSQGKTLDQFIEATLDAMTGEYERLKEFGIRASKDGDKVTFMFKNQKTVVQNNEEAIKKYLLSLGDLPGVAGSSAAVMETLSGKVSNLGDNWDKMLNNMGKSSQGIFNTVIGWLGDFVEGWAIAFKSLDQIRQEVMDKANASNLDNALAEIDGMTEKMVKGGMDQKEAQAKATKYYLDEINISLNARKEDLKTATEANKKKLNDTITMLTKEKDAVELHFNKLKEIELKKLELSDEEKKKLQKKLEDQKKYLEETLILGLSETEKENNEYAERLKKLGLFWVTKQNKTRDELLKEGKITQDQYKGLEIREKEHQDNLEKISEGIKSKHKADQDKFNKEILQTNKDVNAHVLQSLEDRYSSEINAAGNNVLLRKQIDEKYAADKIAIELGQLESTRALLISLGESTVEIDQQIIDKKRQILDAEFLQYKNREAARKEYNLLTLVEQEDEEILQLQEHYKNKELTTEEYEKALLDIKLKYVAQYIQKYESILSNLSNTVQGFQNAELTNLETKKQKELTIAGDNADKKKEIEEKYGKEEKAIKKKYADKMFALQVAQIIASTAQSAIEAFKSMAGIPYVGPALGAVAAGVAIAYGASRIAEAKAQRDAAKQLYEGRYNVVGATDGKNYNDIPHIGTPKTGYYPNPVLISDHGGETVIDAKRTRQLMNSYPDVMRFITALPGPRVKQYADGNLPAVSDKQQANSSDQMVMVLAALSQSVNQLNSKLEHLEAIVVMDQFKKVEAQYDSLNADITKS